MAMRHNPDELVDFPCHYEYKAFGDAADARFADTVRQAVSRVVPVGKEALRVRLSSGGRYQCVTVSVRLENSTQLTAIYAILREIQDLRYLL